MIKRKWMCPALSVMYQRGMCEILCSSSATPQLPLWLLVHLCQGACLLQYPQMLWRTANAVEGGRNQKVCLQFFYLRCEAGQGVGKAEKSREAAINTKSCCGESTREGGNDAWKSQAHKESTAVILCPYAFCPCICMLKRWLCAESTIPTVTFRSW